MEGGGKVSIKTGAALFLALIVALAAAYFYGFEGAGQQEPSSQPASQKDDDDQAVVIEGLTMSSWSDGQRIWDMEADRMTLPRFGRGADLTGISNGTIYRNNEAYLGFSAGAASFDGRNRMEFTGGVTVTSEGKELMVSERMQWDPVTQLVTIPDEARITADGSVMQAKNLTVDLKDEYIYTTGDIFVKQGDNVSITAGNMKYSVTRREMEILGPTTIVIDL